MSIMYASILKIWHKISEARTVWPAILTLMISLASINLAEADVINSEKVKCEASGLPQLVAGFVNSLSNQTFVASSVEARAKSSRLIFKKMILQHKRDVGKGHSTLSAFVEDIVVEVGGNCNKYSKNYKLCTVAVACTKKYFSSSQYLMRYTLYISTDLSRIALREEGLDSLNSQGRPSVMWFMDPGQPN